MSSKTIRLLSVVALIAAVSTLARVHAVHSASSAPIRLGAVFPLHDSQGPLARQEFRGIKTAVNMVNAAGGINGRHIQLVTRELDFPDQAKPVMQSLRRQGITLVLGAYSSALSIPAAAAAAHAGMVYWETGAVADRVTGQGLPSVFRVGANGADLGSNAARFAATQLAPRLHQSVSSLRISVVNVNDAYGQSVANAAMTEARARNMQVVSRTQYNAYLPDWPDVLRHMQQAHPDILILVSHIPDGIAFRRAFLAEHMHVKAFIGSSMAQCMDDFGDALGRDAIGVFASDRPGEGYSGKGITPAAHALYQRLAATWKVQTGQNQPPDEVLAGFSAAWVLVHNVLTATGGNVSPAAIEHAARALNLPRGSLPNSAGVRFATDRAQLGQNLRAAAVIWQWQGIRHSVVVWPSTYASGHIKYVPLPR